MPAQPRKGEARKAFLMRISPGVLAQVERLAAAELRSVNAQVEVLLREALSRRGIGAPSPNQGDD
jgi:hypothetical protein